MGIEDIQISEELETNAPSIKYSGNEGPKSPQEMEQMMMASLEEEYLKYVDDMMEQGIEPMSLEQFLDQAMAEGQMSGGNPLPQDPTKPVNPFQPKPTGPALPDRQMAAYGGIMGLDGRKQYGLGSSLKKFVRKVIPNEVAEVAVKAAPFVAPFNPLLAAGMAGIGGFDQTGRIGSSLKSGLMTYGLGQGARYLGGAEQQTLQNPFTRDAFSMPTGSGGIKNLFKDKTPTGISVDSGRGSGLRPTVDSKGSNLITTSSGDKFALNDPTMFEKVDFTQQLAKAASNNQKDTGILKTIKDFALDNKLLTGLAVGSLGASALMGNMEPEEIQDLQRGEGLDIEGIRAEVIEAYKDPSGEKLKVLSAKYPFLSKRKNIDVDKLAYGGRIGRAEGGIMDLDGKEKDYRNTGGFVDLGAKEKADDVPARLSVNEFVFTADAVRNAGGGDIDQGAEVMENMMKHLEQGGQVSEESQGMAGARDMFATSQRLSEVI